MEFCGASPEMDLSAVILAGGESRRMGRDKAWMELEGQPLVALAVEKVRALGVTEIFISGRAGQDYSALTCPVLFDLKPVLARSAALNAVCTPAVRRCCWYSPWTCRA